MKTWLKVLLSFLLLYILSNFFFSGLITVKRSIEIKRPINQVFMQVANISEWEKWDPWCNQDSTVTISYADIFYGEGASREWKSQESGSGNMTFSKVELNKQIDFDLVFLEPFKSEAKANFTFEQKGGLTLVTWRMNLEYPFLLRVMGVFADSMVGPDFELGLLNLKNVTESLQDPFHILMFEKAAFPVYSKKENCATAEIGITLEAAYRDLIAKMTEDEITIFGKPICIYHNYTDTEVELEAALPVHQITKPNNYTSTIPSATVIKATYVGAYDKTQAAYDALDAFAAKNELSISDSHYQIFITDPGIVSDPNNWVTEIYYTLK